MNQKIKTFLIIAIIIFLVWGFLAFVFLKKDSLEPVPIEVEQLASTSSSIIVTENPTTNSNLKIYRNEEWSFEFEYPNDTKVDQLDYVNNDIELTIKDLSGNILVTIDFVVNNWSKDNLIVRLLNENVVSEVDIRDGKAYKYEEVFNSNHSIKYLIPRGKHWLVIGCEKENQAIIDIIISSMKFFETQNTYRNERLGFEFKFPSNWIINREYTFTNHNSKFIVIISNPIVISNNNGVNDLALDDSFTLSVVSPQSVDNSFKFLEKTISSITVDSIEGQKFEYEFKGFPHTTIVLPLGDSKILLATGDGSRPYVDELNQILSSFRFLKNE